jgi:hypothetical protein
VGTKSGDFAQQSAITFVVLRRLRGAGHAEKVAKRNVATAKKEASATEKAYQKKKKEILDFFNVK